MKINLEGNHNGIKYFIRDFSDCPGKCYCVTKINESEFSRYLHPDGWKEFAHYWPTPEEAINCLKQNNFELSGPTKEEAYWERERRAEMERAEDMGVDLI